MSLSLTFDAVLSRVRLQVTGLPPATAYAVVERSTDQLRWTTVRGASALTQVGGVAAVDDYEFAADIANYYRVWAYTATGDELGPTLNANPYFETDTADWSASGGTIARSTTQAHEGSASLLLTPDGVTASVAVSTVNPVTVTEGAFYLPWVWVRCAAARSISIGIVWRNAANVFLSTSVTTMPVSAGTWTLIQGVHTAPATAARALLIGANLGGTPPAGHTCHIDEAGLSQVGSGLGPVFTGSITPMLGGVVWLKSVARPFLNRQVSVRDFSEVSRPSRAGVFEVVGRSLPVSVTDVAGSRRWTMEVTVDDPDDARDLELLLAAGDVLLVHVPASGRLSAVPGGYVTVGDVRMVTPPTLDLRMRVLSLPFVEVAAPGPDVVGATVTCQTVLNTYPTCAAVLAAHETCLSLMELVGDPEDVLVP